MIGEGVILSLFVGILLGCLGLMGVCLLYAWWESRPWE
jgi:hypothetical protein